MDAKQAWASLCANLGMSADSEELHRSLEAAYNEPHRKYHTLQHLSECFLHIPMIEHVEPRAREVMMVLWFHDAVYDPVAAPGVNELKSAQWAGRALAEYDMPGDAIGRVVNSIMATGHRGAPTTSQEQFACDIDLAILGSLPERYQEYAKQIREEYAFVPFSEYRTARVEVLRAFLQRRQIYWTALFAGMYEKAARANMQREIVGW